MAIITTRGLTRIYNPKTVPVYALRHVDLSFEEGEFTSLVGPSGSGKTTLLNLLGGLDTPSSGEVVVDGVSLAQMGDSELIDFRLQHIGFIFQAYNLIPVFTAAENVAFILLLQKRPRQEIDQRVQELLTEVGLGDRLNARPKELSGGQQQRVAVARALASRPRFILADEPTANLDSQSAMKLLDIMEKMNREHRMTFIFSTHDQRVINRARRVIRLVDGAVESDQIQQPEPHQA